MENTNGKVKHVGFDICHRCEIIQENGTMQDVNEDFPIFCDECLPKVEQCGECTNIFDKTDMIPNKYEPEIMLCDDCTGKVDD